MVIFFINENNTLTRRLIFVQVMKVRRKQGVCRLRRGLSTELSTDSVNFFDLALAAARVQARGGISAAIRSGPDTGFAVNVATGRRLRGGSPQTGFRFRAKPSTQAQ